MAIIQVDNKIVEIDAEDLDFLLHFNWHIDSHGYPTANIKMHRLLINLPKDKVVDHINHNPLDNRKENLRIATRSQNAANMVKKKPHSSQFRGVYFNPKHSKSRPWEVRMRYKDKEWKEWFYTELEAAKAYDENRLRFYGKFSILNFKGS